MDEGQSIYEPPQGGLGLYKWKLKRFIIECARVLNLTKKPTKEEYKVIVKVSGLGILVIGAIGFLVYLTRELLLAFFK